jgi:DNA-binding response OmpR family regulator
METEPGLMDGCVETTRRKLILVVDDSVVFLKVISTKLGSFGYDVKTAVDGSAAVSAVRESKPDLILLDLNFPPDVAHGGGLGWDGFFILTWMRRMEQVHGIPVIAITGENVEQYRQRCQEAGILEVLEKPVDIEVLVATIKATLNQTEPQVQQAPPSAPRFTSSRRILFVDDENDWRQMAIRHLSDHGYEVVTTETGAGALKEAARIRPDAIVVDLKLAAESGLRVMRVLSTAHPSVPILVYTGMGLDPAAKNELINQGAFQCLRLRSMQELLTAVELAMEKRRQNMQAEGEPARPKRAQRPEVGFTSVLIVDDDFEFTQVLREFLESQSFSVTCVPDATEGLRQLAAIDFDLILCDVVLPGPSGEDFYRQVERVKPVLCQRFVFMTGHYADPRTDNFIRRVRALMLWKPFPLADLLSAARTIRKREGLARAVLKQGIA